MAKSKKKAPHHRRKKKVSKPVDIYGFAQSLIGEKHEVSMHELTAVRVNRAKLNRMPEYADSLSFKKRLAAWRQVVEETVKNKQERICLQNLGHRIANLEQDRHKVTHGLWQWTPANAAKLYAWSFRPNVAFRDNHFSADRLFKLLRRIAQANFELSEPKFPRNKEKQGDWFGKKMLAAATKGRDGSWSLVSRQFLLVAQGTRYATLVHPEDRRPKPPPQQSSSPESQALLRDLMDQARASP